MSVLGFCRVEHETAETINNVTKNHVTERANLNQNLNSKTTEHQFVKESSLGKLAFTMND
jgi:hypothetical protein